MCCRWIPRRAALKPCLSSVPLLEIVCHFPWVRLNSPFFRHHHWFLWISLGWHSIFKKIKKGLKEGKQFQCQLWNSQQLCTPSEMISLRFVLSSSWVLKSFLGLLSNLLASNSLVSKCKTFPVAKSDKVPSSLCLENIFQQHTFIFKKRHISCYLELVRPLWKKHNQDLWL